MWQDMKYWPSGDVSAELLNDDPELNKDITSPSTLLSEDVITSAENRISGWLKLKRVIALVLIYKQKLLESVKTNKEPSPEIHRSCNLSQWVYWTNLLEIECIFSTHQEIATN